MMNRSGESSKGGKSGRQAAAGAHESGGRLHVVLLVPADGPAPWRVVEARSFDSDHPPELAPMLRTLGITELTRVAPASGTLCRTVSIPVASTPDSEPQIAGAIALLAEAELPAALPAHRRAGGLIGEPMTDGARTALLTGWMDSAPVEPISKDIPERWTTPVAALAALWGGRGALAWCGSPDDGAASVVASSPAGVAARVVRADHESEARFGEDVREAVHEVFERLSAEAPALGTGPVSIGPGAMSSLRGRVSGLREDDAWFSNYAIALGAAMLAGDPSPCVRGLASLSDARPKQALTPGAKAVAWASEPGRAYAAIVACAVLLLLVPLGLTWARWKVLSSRVQQIQDRSGGRDELERKAALYNQLAVSRWPMTKLLNDMSTLAPVGVSLQNVRLSPGQPVTLKGLAKSQELVTAFQNALNTSHIFRKAIVIRTETKDSGVDFDLTAEVASPFVPHPVVADADLAKDTDFAAKPLAVRLYGAGASNDSTEVQAARSSRNRRGDRGNGDTKRPDPASSDRKATPSDSVPPPVTDEQIAKMDLATSQREWVSRKTYAPKHPNLDAATKARLDDEWPKIKARFEQLNKGGGA